MRCSCPERYGGPGVLFDGRAKLVGDSGGMTVVMVVVSVERAWCFVRLIMALASFHVPTTVSAITPSVEPNAVHLRPSIGSMSVDRARTGKQLKVRTPRRRTSRGCQTEGATDTSSKRRTTYINHQRRQYGVIRYERRSHLRSQINLGICASTIDEPLLL